MSIFLCFEGVDGVGKSTQMRLFCDWLQGRGAEVTACRDPGGTVLGERIREVLLDLREVAVCPPSEMLLYMASRAQLVSEVIRPALDGGNVVVTDRFLLATLAYQGWAGALDPAEIRRVGQLATQGLLPQLTFLLDMPAASAAQRFGQRDLDRMESRGLDYLEAVRRGYHQELPYWPAAVSLIDASASMEEVQEAIRREFLQRFSDWAIAGDKPQEGATS